MKWIEAIRLKKRAQKYRTKKDVGGIAYILSSIKKDETVFDIGAHKAGYLYFMLKQVGKLGHLYAFEPQLRLFNYLTKVKKDFNWSNVTIEHLAISDQVGTATLFIPTDQKKIKTSPCASIIKSEGHVGITELVPTQTLDNYCQQNNIHPQFIKIDVEGNELNVLKGGLKTLKKHRPKMIIEIEARHIGQERVKETFQFLLGLEFKGEFIHNLNRKPLAEFNFDLYQNLNDRKNYCNNFVFE